MCVGRYADAMEWSASGMESHRNAGNGCRPPGCMPLGMRPYQRCFYGVPAVPPISHNNINRLGVILKQIFIC